jgi:formylglycine-generating enzyme required for sulfatase activity
MKNGYELSFGAVYRNAACGFRRLLMFFLMFICIELSAQQVQIYTETGDGTISFDMVYVEGGVFTLGCSSDDMDCDEDEYPLSRVTLSSYRIGETEVTQRLWKAVMWSNPSETQCDDCPVTNVSWEDVQTFLSKLKGKTGKSYRLPTEAEWEYAARGGQTGEGHVGAVDHYAWHSGNSNGSIHPVKQKSPNGLGLYDMLGNAWEWCSDWYGPYTIDRKKDPKGPSTSNRRANRGGGWNRGKQNCRESNRSANASDCRDGGVGFRLVVSQ